jgi:DNA-binding transcriptional LysR family regulator
MTEHRFQRIFLFYHSAAPMLSPHRLRLLMELSRRGTIAAVADALAYTPSTVSEQLRTLEGEVGVTLLERGPRSVRLTPAADALVRDAETILAGLDAARADARAVAGLERGTITLASFPSAGASIVSEALRRLRAERPGLALRVLDAEPTESLALLGAGEVDAAVVYEYAYAEPRRADGIVQRHLLDDPMLACLPPDRPAARNGRVALADLRDEPFVAGRAGSACFEFARAACARRGFEPEVAFETDDIGFTCALVNAGLAVALMPDLLVRSAAAPVRAVPTRPALPPRRVSVAYRATAEQLDSVRELVGALSDAAIGD